LVTQVSLAGSWVPWYDILLIFFLYTDGVYGGSDKEGRLKLEQVMRENCQRPAKGHL
jgi:hypothetical protein